MLIYCVVRRIANARTQKRSGQWIWQSVEQRVRQRVKWQDRSSRTPRYRQMSSLFHTRTRVMRVDRSMSESVEGCRPGCSENAAIECQCNKSGHEPTVAQSC